MADFTELYNTVLSDPEEREFKRWLESQGAAQNKDMSKDLQDYDLRGMWRNQGKFGEDGHASDAFKKPNHPTFSDQSIYHGVDGYQGGKWTEDAYEAGPNNFYPKEVLERYFKTVEPGQKLKFPNITKSLQK